MFNHHLFGHELLRTLVAIVDRGSFAKAAEQLHCTQAAVSLQVSRLEAQTELALFAKSGRQMVLTPAGAILVDFARRILALNVEATHALHGHRMDGALRLGAPQDIAEEALPEVLRQFSALFPRVRLEVRVERNQKLIEDIQRGEFDIAVALTLHGFKWQLPASSEISRITQPKMHWLASQHFKVFTPISRDAPLPLILLEPPCIFRTHAVAALEAAGVSYRVAYTTASLSGLRAAIEAGMGVTARLLGSGDRSREITPLTKQPGMKKLPKLSNLHLHLFCKIEPRLPAIAALHQLLKSKLEAELQ